MQDEEKVRVHTQVSNALLTIEQLGSCPQDEQCPLVKRRLRSELEGLMRSRSCISGQDWQYKMDLYDTAVDALSGLPAELANPVPHVILEQMHIDLQLVAVMSPEIAMVHAGGKSGGENRISRYL